MDTDALLEDLMQNEFIQRIRKNASCTLLDTFPFQLRKQVCLLGGFMRYSGRNFKYMQATVEAIKKRNDPPSRCEPPSGCNPPRLRQTLHRPYDHNVGAFPGCSINLGKQTVTFPHTDNYNLSHSWCSITPLGDFKHEDGGHLVLWDFGLIVDFPAGSTILIPSALVVHSNTALKTEEETRYSVVQYAAGGLFRWVENGFMTQEERQSKGLDQQAPGSRWSKAIGMFTHISEIEESSHFGMPAHKAASECQCQPPIF
jgi:hypothetical protein